LFYVRTFKIRLSEDFRQEDESLLNDFLESVIPEKVESHIINHPVEPFWSVLVIYTPPDDITMEDGERILFDTYEPLTQEEEMTFFRLKSWRDSVATKEQLPRHQILHDAHLMTIVKIHPQKPADLQKLKGISVRKLRKYEGEILAFFRKVKKSP